MFGHHPATVRLAGRKRHARLESSEALAELPAVARTAVELHGCCARVSLAEALLCQHIDGVAKKKRPVYGTCMQPQRGTAPAYGSLRVP